MKRARFEQGAPEITSNGNISWTFPESVEEKSFFDWIEGDKEKIRAELLKRLKEDMKHMHLRIQHYPYSSSTLERVLGFQIQDNCGCCSIKKCLGDYFLSTHNLDGFPELVCAFNIGANALELYNPELIVPRMKIQDGIVIIDYPLPQDFDRIHEKSPKLAYLLTGGGLEKNFEIVGLKLVRKDFESTPQVVELREGKIEIRDGFVLGKHFLGFNIRNATYPIATLVNSCTYV